MSLQRYNASGDDETDDELIRFPSRPTYVSVNIQGNPTFVNVHKALQYNSGSASGTQGYLTMMSREGDGDKHRLLTEGSESDTLLANGTKTPTRPSTPSQFIEQPHDWFKPGRFFSIWAPFDAEIHNKKFILLDSQNIEGKGVLVETRDAEGLKQLQSSSSAYRTVMALREPTSCMHHSTQHSRGSSMPNAPTAHPKGKELEALRALDEKFQEVHLDDLGHQFVAPGTFIFLEHTYNIPFVKYKCVDHGMIEDEAFDDLRFHYVEYLISNWRLTSRARQKYGHSTH